MQQLKDILHQAVTEAILEIGLEQFKKTSFFLSNKVIFE